MSVKHGRFTDAELETVSKGEGPVDVKTRMEDFASKIDGVPVTIDDQGELHEVPQPPDPIPIDTSIPFPSTTRKVKATPKRVKKVIAGIPTKILEALKVAPDAEDNAADR